MMIRSALAVCLVLATAVSAHGGCGSASFSELPSIAAGHDVSDLLFADIGGDGDLDLVTVSAAAASFGVHVHINDDGFVPPFAVAGDRPSAVALADMNGDERLDILVTEQAANLEDCRLFGSCASLRQVRADENGGFTDTSIQPRIIPYIESVRRIVAADFNKDGNMDVLIAGAPIHAGDPALHLVWGGTPGTGTNGTIQTFTLNGPIGDVILGDFDDDTYIDFVAAVGQAAGTPASHVDLYRNDAGTFAGVAASRDIQSTDANLRLVTGQFNASDTYLDVAVSTQTTTVQANGSGAYIIRGTGSGGFMSGGGLSLAPRAYHDLAAGDFDEDNDLDVIVAGGELAALYNKGDGFINDWDEIDATGDARRIFAADFNLDGRTDVAYLDQAADTIHILGNNCTSRYIAVSLTAAPSPSTFGGNVKFKAIFTVKPNAPVPTGTVTFQEGSTVLGTAAINASGVASLTLNNLSIGSHTIKAFYGGDGNFGTAASNTLVHTVSRPPFGAPLNVVATGNAAANTITVSWITTADVSTNQVLRRDDTGQWFMVGATSMEQFTDPNVDPSRAYVYTVRSVHATNGTTSPNGNLDLATTINPVRPSDKIIRAADTTDVRSLAQSLRRAAGLAPFPFTDGSLVGLPVKAVHLTELRTAIAEARSALGLPAVPLTQPVITPKVTKVNFNDLQELRTSFY